MRKLAAIMFTDIVGYSAMMSNDEKLAMSILEKNRDIHKTAIANFNGKFIKEIGDGTLTIFQSSVDAVHCALEIQKACCSESSLMLRIGIHAGDIIVSEGDVFGDGVNIAARIEAAGETTGIYISEKVYDDIRNKAEIKVRFHKERSLKNIPNPVKIYTVVSDSAKPEKQQIPQKEVKTKNEKTIIVLPFENMSPDPDQEYFSDGLTEEIITDLSCIKNLLVISRSSAMSFKGTRKTIGEIADKVNVQYVLEGSVRKAGNNLRIIAQLIDAATDSHLWADKFHGTLDDVFNIQEKVSRSIAEALKLKLKPDEDKKLARRPIDNVQVYECYIQARREIDRASEDSLDRAIQLIRNGLDIAGENEYLYAALGSAYIQYFEFAYKTSERYLQKTEECADKCLELNPESSFGHILKGRINFKKCNIKDAVIAIKDGLDNDPSNFEGLHILQYLYAFSGRPDDARILNEKFVAIDPLNPWIFGMKGWIELFDGQFSVAARSFEKMTTMDPKNPLYLYLYAVALALDKQVRKACSVIDFLVKETPATIFTSMGLFTKNAWKGNEASALEALDIEWTDAAWFDEGFSWWMASAFSLIGRKKEALDWLENSVNKGVINYPFFKDYLHWLENIHGEKRFKKLMERVKYEWESFER